VSGLSSPFPFNHLTISLFNCFTVSLSFTVFRLPTPDSRLPTVFSPITHHWLLSSSPLPLIPSLDRGGKIVDNPSPLMKGEAR